MSRKELYDYIEHTQSRPRPALTPFLMLWPSLRYLPRWFPGAHFSGIGERYHQEDKKVWLQLLQDVKQEMVSSTRNLKQGRHT